MEKNKKVIEIALKLVESCLIIASVYLIRLTEISFATCLVFALFSLFEIWFGKECKLSAGAKISFAVIAAVFSVVLGFYAKRTMGITWVIPLVMGSEAIFYNFMLFLSHRNSLPITDKTKSEGRIMFSLIFLFIVALDLIILIFCEYPGIVDPDYAGVLKQIMGLKEYTNQHSIYVTYLIKLCIKIGLLINNSIGTGLFVFSILQIVFFAFCRTYALDFLYRTGVNKVVWWLIAIWIAIMPVNINYSFWISKDVWFAGTMLLLTICTLKVFLAEEGAIKEEKLLLPLSLVAVIILRGNGIFVGAVWLLTFICFSIRNRKRKKWIIPILVSFVLALFLKGPALSLMKVQTNVDCLEGLGVPIQQISRVVVEGNSLTEEESQILSKVVPLDKVAETYICYWCDFEKALIREYGGTGYIENNKTEFLKLYVTLGLKHPGAYIRGWLEEVQGYFIPLNSRFVYRFGVSSEVNDLVSAYNGSEAVKSIYLFYCYLFTYNPLLSVFTCIGFYVWLMIMLFVTAVANREPVKVLINLPGLVLIATLLIAAPVDGEFRYAYPAILSFIPCIAVCRYKLNIK